MPSEAFLHKVNDWVPLLTVLGAITSGLATTIIWVTRRQTAKIERIFQKMTEDHNRNGGAHVVVAGALRAERGQLFQQIGEQINDQNVMLARIDERQMTYGELLGALIDAHNDTADGDEGEGDGCVRTRRVRIVDPTYSGPWRRKTDPKGPV